MSPPNEHEYGAVGPQLTEYTGNRIATALERIADAMERAEKGRPAEWLDRPYRDTTGQPPYPLGDPAPSFPSSGEVEALVAGINEMIEKSGAKGTLRVRLPESFTVK